MEGCCLDCFIKQGNVSSFYDNGGGNFHQSNDRIREFHLHLSDSKLQNAATTTAHLYTLLAKVFEKKQMIRGRTRWDQTHGCAKQYRCSIAYYLMSYLSKSYQIVLDRAVDTPGHQKQFDMTLINKTSYSRQWNTYTALSIHLFDPTFFYLL